MALDQRAVLKAYPNVQGVDDTKAWDANGNEVAIDQSLVDDARVELDKIKYKKDRVTGIGTTEGYPDICTQLDWLYHDMKNNTLNTTGQWYVGITSVKNNIPKP